MSLVSVELENAKFLVKNTLDSMSYAIDAFSSPINSVSPSARRFLNQKQVMAIEKSFANRRNLVKNLRSNIYAQLKIVESFEQYHKFLFNYQSFRDQFFSTERVFDFYLDAINTRGLSGNMGMLLSGCDKIARESLKPLNELGHETPPILSFAEFGQGAAIVRSNLVMWDGKTNPVALLKVVYSSIRSLRITSIFHEVGHSIGAIGWNEEISKLIFNEIFLQSKDKELATLYSSWSKEILADSWSLSQANYASLVGLTEVVAGDSKKAFRISGGPHPMNFLRVHFNAQFIRMMFGKGPWDDVLKVWDATYPLRFANQESKSVIEKSLPLIPSLCKAIAFSKMESFDNKSLSQLIIPQKNSPKEIKKILNKDLSDFSSNWSPEETNPIQSIIGLRVIQMHGKKNQEWIRDKVTDFLTKISGSGQR